MMMIKKQDDYMPLAYEKHIKNRVERTWGNSIYISYPRSSDILMEILSLIKENLNLVVCQDFKIQL